MYMFYSKLHIRLSKVINVNILSFIRKNFDQFYNHNVNITELTTRFLIDEANGFFIDFTIKNFLQNK